MIFFRRWFHFRYAIGLIIALVIILLHIIFQEIPRIGFLDGYTLDYTSSNQWIGFVVDMTYPALFFFLLPLLASLGPGLIAQEDIKNGFNLRLVQQSLKAYMQSNLLVTYLYGFITAALPLSLDYLLVLWLFPNVTPNMVLNRGDGVGLGPIGSTLTYWADQYYKNPILVVILYILLIGFISGLYALFSMFIGIVSRNRYVAISASFLLALGSTILVASFPNVIYSPIYITMPSSPMPLPNLTSLLVLMAIILILLIGGIIYGIYHKTSI
ncbi:hypothetical protein [Levilactobacillus brevis]|uniref:hypothetical protein n=1 Tax=Levilactobacillus brevis TaxID=1580 RepID=UPI00063AA489|nr:hypothetical protein [Levilactobacillus brevis]KLE28723.1 hypothetical protein AAX72_12275 [Levilactobacillus brevis]